MKYPVKVKWLKDNLGITLDMIRYYESQNILSRDVTKKYREYSEEEVEKIWCIKLLIGIGFSAKEIYDLMNDSKFDFDTAIAKKVAELEQKHDENRLYLEFAKSIKLTGMIPNVSKIGSLKFEDFLDYARKNWNFYDDPYSAPFMKMMDTFIQKEPSEWNPDEVERILQMYESINGKDMIHVYALHGYYQVISDMRDLEYDGDTVQKVVHLLYKYSLDYNAAQGLDIEITPQFFAKNTASTFLYGDIAKLHERFYGKEGCLFIAHALSYYGGYDVDDL